MTPTQAELRLDPQRVRVMVCEEVGWTEIDPPFGRIPRTNGGRPDMANLPNVHESLDACRDTFEEGMTKEEKSMFAHELERFLWGGRECEYWFELSAMDHCLAFLATRGKCTL